jgi:hypothetical protein
MAPDFLSNSLFLLEYQWKWFFDFGGGVEGQERRYCCIFFGTTLDFLIDINSISPSSLQFVCKKMFHVINELF